VKRRTVFLSLLAALALLPWICGGERKTLGHDERRRLPGDFANLKSGRTCFELQGAAPAEAIVFVHGLSSPSSIWGELPRMLRDSGYLTLTYDLYGRGWSDRPWATYDLDLFDHQLDALLRKVGLVRRVHLVGLSMGGIIVSEFALRHPDLVASVTLIDPAGFAVEPPGGSALMTTPLVGDWLMQVFGDRALVAALSSSVHDKSLTGDLVRRFLPQLEYAGYKRAFLSTLRHMPLADYTERYSELGRTPLPIEVFWGRQDEITPPAGADLAAHLLPGARIHLLDDAGHLSHYEKTDEVESGMLEFLRSVEAPLQVRLRGPGDDEDIEAGRPAKDCDDCDPESAAERRGGGYSRVRSPDRPGAGSGNADAAGEQR